MTKPDPFRYFKTSREIIRLAVMLYVRFPLSLRNVEDLLHERGIDISHETVRFWWHRFGVASRSKTGRRRTTVPVFMLIPQVELPGAGSGAGPPVPGKSSASVATASAMFSCPSSFASHASAHAMGGGGLPGGGNSVDRLKTASAMLKVGMNHQSIQSTTAPSLQWQSRQRSLSTSPLRLPWLSRWRLRWELASPLVRAPAASAARGRRSGSKVVSAESVPHRRVDRSPRTSPARRHRG